MKTRVDAARREAFEKELAKFTPQLKELWDAVRISAHAQSIFLENLHQVPSLKEIALLCNGEIQKLANQKTLLAELFKVLDARTDLIVEMKDFESKASDPKRLFAPSFRLLYEEKFRKNAYPNLLKLEKKIMTLLDGYKHGNNILEYFVPFNFWLQNLDKNI